MANFLKGLLAVAAGAGEGAAIGRIGELKAKAEKDEKENIARLNDLYAQKREGRASLLEETKYGRRKEVEDEEKAAAITAGETLYQRHKREEETTYQRRKGEKKAAADKYVITGKITDAEGNEDLYGVTKDGTVKIIKEGGKSVAATTATEKLKASAVKEALKMKEEGRSQEDINLWLKSNGLQEWEEYPTGEVKKTGGFLGFGTKKTKVMGTRIKEPGDKGKTATIETDAQRRIRLAKEKAAGGKSSSASETGKNLLAPAQRTHTGAEREKLDVISGGAEQYTGTPSEAVREIERFQKGPSPTERTGPPRKGLLTPTKEAVKEYHKPSGPGERRKKMEALSKRTGLSIDTILYFIDKVGDKILDMSVSEIKELLKKDSP